ncbi:MAG: RidA family protein [Planctomycetota bacterium]
MSAEENFAKLGLELPPAPKPMGLYKPAVIAGNMLYLSGHGPLKPDGTLIVGRLGADLDVHGGAAAAQQTGLAMLATIKAKLGSLDRIKRVIKLLGWVPSADDFGQQPAVINGCSQLFSDVWGVENGISARSAIGTNALPGAIAVEIEGIFEFE